MPASDFPAGLVGSFGKPDSPVRVESKLPREQDHGLQEQEEPRMSADSRERAVVLYDGECAFCQRSVKLLKRLDWLGRFASQDARDVPRLPPCDPPLDPAKLLEEMHIVPVAGAPRAGFRAYRWMAWRLPPLWPAVPFLYLPGATWLGNRLYRWVAKHRYQLVPCEGGVCKVGR